MGTIFIFHGTVGSPEENWFPWLKKKLEKLGHDVYVPKFPTPEGQNLKNWLKVFDTYKDLVDSNTIFVGHSLAPAFILYLLESRSSPVKAAFLVSGWTGLLNDEFFDPLIKTFCDRKFNWEKIRGNCKHFTVLHGDNDPYVPVPLSEQLADNLKVKPLLIKMGGHLNKEFGFTKFDFLLDLIKKELSS